MFRRIAAVSALALAALLAVAAPASAYGPTSGGGTVSDSSVAPGGSVQFCGQGFQGGTDITVTVDGDQVTTTTADDDGSFCVKVTLPSAAGSYVVMGSGLGANGEVRTVSSTVQVLAAGANGGTGGSDLPRTGSEIGTQLWIAGGLLAFGAGLVALTVVRRRDGGMMAA